MTKPFQESAVILVSFHFYPSIEIGARRVTALAKYLSSQGIAVWVVSEFGGHPYTDGDTIWPGVFAIPIKRPRRLVLDTLVSLKRLLQRTNDSPTPSSPKSAPQGREPDISGDPIRKRLPELRVWFLRKVFFIDDNKKWAWRAANRGLAVGRVKGARAVFSSGPPFTSVVGAARIAAKLRIPHIADMRDPWTDHMPPLAHAYAPRGMELHVMRFLEKRVLRAAAAITSTGATVTEILASRYPEIAPKLHVIRNGYDGDIREAKTSTGHRLDILFAGELYVQRNPFPLLEALQRLLDQRDVDPSRIQLTFMGRCAYYRDESLAEWLSGKRVQSVVTILPQLPPESVSRAAEKATVLLNLAQQQPLSVPAKTFEHLASGRELLLISEDDSETSRLVAGIKGVLQVDPSKPAAIDVALRSLYDRHVVQGTMDVPVEASIGQYSRENANKQFAAILDAVAPLNLRKSV